MNYCVTTKGVDGFFVEKGVLRVIDGVVVKIGGGFSDADGEKTPLLQLAINTDIIKKVKAVNFFITNFSYTLIIESNSRVVRGLNAP